MGNGFVVTERDIPCNCLKCPLNYGESRYYNAFVQCTYGRSKYEELSLNHRPDYCKLKELEDEQK